MLLYDYELRKSLSRIFGEALGDFLRSLTSPGARYYMRVNILKASPEEVVDRLRARGLDVYRDEHLPEAIYIPVKGPNKVDLRDKIVVVDKRAAESVYMGSNLYAPGVLRCSDGVDRGVAVSIVTETGLVVAEGVAVMSCSDMLRRGRGLAVKVTNSVYRLPPIASLPEYRDGLIYPQSLPAMYVSRVLNPKPYEVIIDTCAAPGGKTGHIIELTMGRALVLAFDHSRRKLKQMVGELERLGHTGFVDIWRTDSRYLHIDFSWARADKIVVDPPCSALGVRPKLFDVKSYRDVVNAANYQIQFLRSAARLLKKGGVLVYSTCTVTVEENEEVIERFIDEYRCIEPVAVDLPVGGRGFKGSRFGDLYARFHPHEHDTTGYFIAKLVKICGD